MTTTDQGPPTPEGLEASVKRKLGGSILRRLAGSERVLRHPDYIVYGVYSWAHELLLVAPAVGLSHPLVTALSDTSSRSEAQSSLAAIATYPVFLLYPAAGCIALWIVIRVWIGVRKLAEHGPLIAACRRELGSIEGDLQDALQQENPTEALTSLLTRSKEVVDRYYKAQVWPWPIGPEGPEVDAAISQRVTELCNRFRANWRADR